MQNSKIKLLITAIVMVVLIFSASVLYRKITSSGKVGTYTEKESSSADDRKMMTDFKVYDADGNKVSLSDYRGKPIVVNFWASWCGYCTAEMPHLQKAYEQYGDEIQFLMVDMVGNNGETKENADAVISENGYTFKVLYDTDGSADSAYNVRSLPMTIFVDREGRIADGVVGALTEKGLENYISLIK